MNNLTKRALFRAKIILNYQLVVSAQFLIGILFSVAPFSTVKAHPVTFKEGIVFSLFNQNDFSLWHANYSFSSRFALGLDYLKVGHGVSEQLGLLRANFLVKRWLGKGSQANLYLLSGLGVKKPQRQLQTPFNRSAVGLIGTQIDYETQSFYTALMSRLISNHTLAYEQQVHHVMYRIGMAPYISHSNDLQTWLVAQLSYHSHMPHLPNLTMLIRAFHKTTLWEIGADTQGHPWLHIMTHF